MRPYIAALPLFALWLTPVACAAVGRQPNILFLLADDLGWGDLGCYGHPYIKTPNLDRLAAQGTRFERFYVCGSVCHSSRSSLMTGRFLAHCFGDVHDFPDGRRVNVSMAPGTVPVTRILKQAGYVTAHIGKWHLNEDAFEEPGKYGIDFMQSHERRDLGTFRGDKKERNGTDQALVRAAIDFMKRHRDRPFYCQLWFTVPHSPVRRSAEELTLYADLKPSPDDFANTTCEHFKTRRQFTEQMRAWCAQISGHDDNVGELLRALDALGLADNTIVFYTSDNGPAPPAREAQYVAERNAMGSAGPLRGRKNSLYEGGIRVPAIVRWPGRVPAGRTDKVSVWTAADWQPTVCAAAGVPLGGYAADGRDVSDIWRGASRPCDRELVWGRSPREMALREGDWKLYEDRGSVWLFDLDNDPNETTDLFARQPDRMERMRGRLEEYRKSLSETIARGREAAL